MDPLRECFHSIYDVQMRRLAYHISLMAAVLLCTVQAAAQSKADA